MLERFERMLDDESEPPEVVEFGFWHDVDEVFDAGNMLLSFHILPCAGGWEDQTEEWTHDLKAFLAIRNRKQWERKHEGGGADEIIDKLTSNGDGEAWDSLIRE